MKVVFHRNFKKQYRKLPTKVQKQFNVRLAVFLEDPNDPILNIHTLKGNKYAVSSMNVSGDYRALFIQTKTRVTFYKIGSHSELYS